MPQLATSQAFLEQSALLLQAYPESTRITTKYFFPTERRAEKHKREKSQSKKSSTDTTTPSAPVASLVLKTYNPATGIVIKYQTNKAQEVGRLMTSLGKLAGGADVAGLGLSGPAGDVEMVDAPAVPVEEVQNAKTGAGASGKGKKKGGKGKR